MATIDMKPDITHSCALEVQGVTDIDIPIQPIPDDWDDRMISLFVINLDVKNAPRASISLRIFIDGKLQQPCLAYKNGDEGFFFLIKYYVKKSNLIEAKIVLRKVRMGRRNSIMTLKQADESGGRKGGYCVQVSGQYGYIAL